MSKIVRRLSQRGFMHNSSISAFHVFNNSARVLSSIRLLLIYQKPSPLDFEDDFARRSVRTLYVCMFVKTLCAPSTSFVMDTQVPNKH